jgi:hypothetical protein
MLGGVAANARDKKQLEPAPAPWRFHISAAGGPALLTTRAPTIAEPR